MLFNYTCVKSLDENYTRVKSLEEN